MFKPKVKSRKSKFESQKPEGVRYNEQGTRSGLRTSFAVFFLLLGSCFFSPVASAQCAMCRAALETEGNKSKGEAVNDGIVYLMLIPYILVGGIGYAVYRMNKKKK